MSKRFHLISAFLLVLAMLGCYSEAIATHIRAGEITAIKISNYKYVFRITGYRDVLGGEVDFGQGILDFGDGSDPISLANYNSRVISISEEVEQVYKEVTHTFPGNREFTISYTELNRNGDVVNMDNSISTPFHVETTLLIHGAVGTNSSPSFLVPPVDQGVFGVAFIHNPGAFDLDGDSLSYEMAIPKLGINTDVNGYLAPNDPVFYENYTTGNEDQDGNPTFDIDPLTGTLIWDAPGGKGLPDKSEFNLAFVVKEWRFLFGEWYQIGQVTRDMQIIVFKSDNNRPELQVPPELCVEAGTEISELINATDPDGDQVIIEGYGGPFILSPEATLARESTNSYRFEWATGYEHIRKYPYEVQFKVTDIPPADRKPSLVNFETWNIRVVAPAPENLALKALDGKALELNWDEYAHASADSIQVWRRAGSFDFTPSNCVLGMPEEAGYHLVKSVLNRNGAEFISSFIDDDNGNGIGGGTEHCYRLVAIFNEPGGGISYASEEICITTAIEEPIVLNVDVESTAFENGEIFVRWMAPVEENEELLKPPYTYEVTRFDGLQGTDNAKVIVTDFSGTSLTDQGLATELIPYNYQVSAKNREGVSIGSSKPASSVWLETTADVTDIQLRWTVGPTQWSISSQAYPYHYIYRDHVDDSNVEVMHLIDSVKVVETGLTYVDNGRFNGVSLSDKIEYTYQVDTRGSYSHEDIEEPLINKSQRSKAQPNDDVKPCPPISLKLMDDFDCTAFMSDKSCGFSDFYHQLEWEYNVVDSCGNDIKEVEIQFSPSGREEDFEEIARLSSLSYTNRDLDSFKGCYRIRSWDRSGNASEEYSNTICVDNCPNFELPNAFSPNGDGINDTFVPFDDDGRCPRFVVAIQFRVFDRAGDLLFDSKESERFGDEFDPSKMSWDGKTTNGRSLEPGVYFYGVDVEFDRLAEANEEQTFKGWIQILK